MSSDYEIAREILNLKKSDCDECSENVEQLNRITVLITKHVKKRLFSYGIVERIKTCNHKPETMGYIEWQNFSKEQLANGKKQQLCTSCERWFFPSEF